MDSIISDFHIDWRLLLAQLLNFSVVVAVLYFFAFKPLIKTMVARSDKISQGLKDADDSRLRLLQAENDGKNLLKEARQQASDILTEANLQAENNQKEILKKTKEQVKLVIDQEKAKILFERQQVLADLKKEGLALAVSLSEKILKREIDKSSDSDFIEKLI